mgnify:FL=1
MSVDSNDPWQTWTDSYADRCKEVEDSIHDILLQNESEPSFTKKYMFMGICIGVTVIIIIGVVILFII